MKTCLYSRDVFLHRRFPDIVYVFILLTGSTLGALCAVDTGALFAALMRGFFSVSVSIVSLVYALLLPYLAVLLAAIYSKSSALYPICFLKLFTFSFVLMGLKLAFGSAGWLVCGLLMFSDFISVLFLVSLCFHHIHGFRPSVYWDIGNRMIGIIAISLLEYYYIAPFLAQIIVC